MTWVITDQLVSRLSTFYGLDDHGWASHNLDERGVSRGTPLGLMMPRQNISSAWILRFEKKHRRSYACHARIVLHLYFHCIVLFKPMYFGNCSVPTELHSSSPFHGMFLGLGTSAEICEAKIKDDHLYLATPRTPVLYYSSINLEP